MSEATNMPEMTQNRAIEDDLGAILAQLGQDQIRFLIARAEAESDADACREIGLSRSTMSHWSVEIRDLLKDARALMAQDGLITAMHLRRRSLAKAMAVKVKGLDSDDEKLRQAVATEIIEWELGRATQPTDNKHSGEIAVKTYVSVSPDDWDHETDHAV